jgi:hypothetical protein
MRSGRSFLALFGMALSGSIGLAGQTPERSLALPPLDSLLGQPRVAHYLRYFTGPGRDVMARTLNRGSRFRGLIRDRLSEAGLPAELEYVPLIESGYASGAVSKAGAVGMWQFVPETARRMGLEVGLGVDERRDPVRATDAAVRHLSELTREFGSTLLAAAAYNSGSRRVAEGLGRLRPGDTATSYSDFDFFRLADERLLPLETREYVPRLLAAAAIGRDPARYGFSADPLGLGARSSAAPGQAGLVTVRARAPRAPRAGALVRVKRGETIEALAAAHDVSAASLRRVNALPPWYVLKPGQSLRLPR